MLQKIIFTARNLGAVARHHYGNGPLGVLKFVFYSFFKINTFVIFQLDLSRQLSWEGLGGGLEVLTPTLEELQVLRKGKDLPREFYSDRFHKVRSCYLAMCGDEIAYIHWVYFSGDYSRFLRLQPDSAEINYVTTLPVFRGHHLSSLMLVKTALDLKELGYNRIFVVAHENTVALIGNLKLAGFQEVMRIKAAGPFGRRIDV